MRLFTISNDTRCKVNGVMDKEYIVWKDIAKRCLNGDFKDKYPTYRDCTISKNGCFTLILRTMFQV